MKFTNIILAVTTTASLVVANPMAGPIDTSPNVANTNVANTDVFAREDCGKCDEFVNKCMKSWLCWFNPWGCRVSCRTDACRQLDECHNKCGFDC